MLNSFKPNSAVPIIAGLAIFIIHSIHDEKVAKTGLFDMNEKQYKLAPPLMPSSESKLLGIMVVMKNVAKIAK